MADTYTDGDILLDTFTATIATQSYLFNNVTINVPNVEAQRNGEDGTLAAERNLKDTGRINGSGEVQIDVSAKNQELINETFTIPADVHPDGTETDYVIKTETASAEINGNRVRQITFRRLINQLP